MPKARTHQTTMARRNTGRQAQKRTSKANRNAQVYAYQKEGGRNGEGATTTPEATQNRTRINASAHSARNSNPQGLMMPVLVALVCFGMAVALAFFSTDPNRYLFSGLAILMGCMWSYMAWARLRRLRR
ncbi:hypothetical protein [Ktedonospora formicarum]|uniref:hypothetical protein n=1 Tax=Ktedonospora formicarum TaxID=2778364 RepID=UPI001C68ADB0|nr:hypothetical protein [Ktedonospora formicarum]